MYRTIALMTEVDSTKGTDGAIIHERQFAQGEHED